MKRIACAVVENGLGLTLRFDFLRGFCTGAAAGLVFGVFCGGAAVLMPKSFGCDEGYAILALTTTHSTALLEPHIGPELQFLGHRRWVALTVGLDLEGFCSVLVEDAPCFGLLKALQRGGRGLRCGDCLSAARTWRALAEKEGWVGTVIDWHLRRNPLQRRSLRPREGVDA